MVYHKQWVFLTLLFENYLPRLVNIGSHLSIAMAETWSRVLGDGDGVGIFLPSPRLQTVGDGGGLTVS